MVADALKAAGTPKPEKVRLWNVMEPGMKAELDQGVPFEQSKLGRRAAEMASALGGTISEANTVETTEGGEKMTHVNVTITYPEKK